VKRLIYSEYYINDIKNSELSESKISKKDIKETVVGYSINQACINNEPLSKLVRYIVKQLNFFNDSNYKLLNQLKDIIENQY